MLGGNQKLAQPRAHRVRKRETDEAGFQWGANPTIQSKASARRGSGRRRSRPQGAVLESRPSAMGKMAPCWGVGGLAVPRSGKAFATHFGDMDEMVSIEERGRCRDGGGRE